MTSMSGCINHRTYIFGGMDRNKHIIHERQMRGLLVTESPTISPTNSSNKKYVIQLHQPY